MKTKAMMKKKRPKKSRLTYATKKTQVRLSKNLRRSRTSQSAESGSRKINHQGTRFSEVCAGDASTSLVKSRLSPATAETARSGLWCRWRKDENKHRDPMWNAAKGIDEGEVLDEGRASDGRTPGKHESRATRNAGEGGTTERQ